MEALYAQALWNEAQKKDVEAKAIVSNLRKSLKAQGREKMLAGILRELKRLEAQNMKLGPVVEVASKKDEAHALKEAAALKIKVAQVTINPELIQGWRASDSSRLVDSSGKRALIELYQRITSDS